MPLVIFHDQLFKKKNNFIFHSLKDFIYLREREQVLEHGGGAEEPAMKKIEDNSTRVFFVDIKANQRQIGQAVEQL